MEYVKLSKEARNLLRRRANGEHIEVAPDNLAAYRELANAGVMYPLSAFMRRPESVFRFTEEGWSRREAGPAHGVFPGFFEVFFIMHCNIM